MNELVKYAFLLFPLMAVVAYWVFLKGQQDYRKMQWFHDMVIEDLERKKRQE